MRIPRIHHPAPLHSGALVALDESAANHVARVLRLKPGAPLTLFDGGGGEYRAELTRLERRLVEAAVGERVAREAESPLPVTLALGISKGERMDYAIQKAVELGVTALVPLATARSVVELKGERLEKKVAHWRGVVTAACGQCGRNRLPELRAPQGLAAWLAEGGEALRLTLDPRADTGLAGVARPAGAVHLLVGPEGGLDEGELAAAAAAGYRGVRLGPRVLRTETAAVAALTAIQTLWGDLG